jgi:hypothetical protein
MKRNNVGMLEQINAAYSSLSGSRAALSAHAAIAIPNQVRCIRLTSLA